MHTATTIMYALYIAMLLLLVGLPTTVMASSTSLPAATYATSYVNATTVSSAVVEELDTTATTMSTSTLQLLKETWTSIAYSTTTTIGGLQQQLFETTQAYVIKPTTNFLAMLYSTIGSQANTTTDWANSTSSGEINEWRGRVESLYQGRPRTSNVDGERNILINDIHRAIQNSSRAIIKNKALKAANQRMAAQEVSLRTKILNLTIDLLKERQHQAMLVGQLQLSEATINELKQQTVEFERTTIQLEETLAKEHEAHEATKQSLFLTIRMYEAAMDKIHSMEKTNNASVCINVEELGKLVQSVRRHPGWCLAWLMYLVYRVMACLRRRLASQRQTAPHREEQQQRQTPFEATSAEEQASSSPQAELPPLHEPTKQVEHKMRGVVADDDRESVADNEQLLSPPSSPLVLLSTCSLSVASVPLMIPRLSWDKLPVLGIARAAVATPQLVEVREVTRVVADSRPQPDEPLTHLLPLLSSLQHDVAAHSQQQLDKQLADLQPLPLLHLGADGEEGGLKQAEGVQAKPHPAEQRDGLPSYVESPPEEASSASHEEPAGSTPGGTEQSDYLNFNDSRWQGSYRPGWYAPELLLPLEPQPLLGLTGSTGALVSTSRAMSKMEEFMRCHLVLQVIKNNRDCPLIYEPPALILTCGQVPVWVFNGRLVATKEEVTGEMITKAYRKLMAKLHPDRHRGHWWHTLAKEWTQEVTGLYHQLMHTMELIFLFHQFRQEKERWEQMQLVKQAQEELERMRRESEQQEREIEALWQQMAARFRESPPQPHPADEPEQRRKVHATRRRRGAGGTRGARQRTSTS